MRCFLVLLFLHLDAALAADAETPGHFEPGTELSAPQQGYPFQKTLREAIFLPGTENAIQKIVGLPGLAATHALIKAFFVTGAPRVDAYFSQNAAGRLRLAAEGWRGLLLSSGRPISDSTYPILVEGLHCGGRRLSVTARAAAYVQAANSLRANAMAMEERRGTGPGSNPANFVFGAARQPRKNALGIGADTIVLSQPACGHVVVFSKNVPYIVELPPPDLDDQHSAGTERLQQAFQRIVNCSSEQHRDVQRSTGVEGDSSLCATYRTGARPPVGILGNLPRSRYGAAYHKLKQRNGELVQNIECALLTISLEDQSPKDNRGITTDPAHLIRHARGRQHPGNRWVGKGMSATFTPQGLLVECEHAIADGGPCSELVDGLLIKEQHTAKALCGKSDELAGDAPLSVRPESWDVSGMEEDFRQANDFYTEHLASTRLDIFHVAPSNNREFCLDTWQRAPNEETKAHKKQRCLNDNATFQTAHFLREYRLNRRVSLSEPVRLAGARLGFNLSNTPEMRAFADKALPLLAKEKAPDETARRELRQLLLAANIAHERGIYETRNGLGAATPLLGISPLAPWAHTNEDNVVEPVHGAPAWISVQQRLFGNKRIYLVSRPEQNISNMGYREIPQQGRARRVYGGSAFAPSPNNRSGTGGQVAVGFMTGSDGKVNGVYYGPSTVDIRAYERDLGRNWEFLGWVANGGSPQF